MRASPHVQPARCPPLQLNDPAAQDSQIEAAVSAVVEGLFCALATLGIVPIIRCPRGGAAEHVAAALDARLRDALTGRSTLFSEGSGGAGLAASLQRPLLCLFDRNFELSVVLQHGWTYKPLVCMHGYVFLGGGCTVGKSAWAAAPHGLPPAGPPPAVLLSPASGWACMHHLVARPAPRHVCNPPHKPTHPHWQVHDVLGMRLNRVTLQEGPSPGQPAGGKKSYEVDDGEGAGRGCWAPSAGGRPACCASPGLSRRRALPPRVPAAPSSRRWALPRWAQRTSFGAVTARSSSPRLRSRWRWSCPSTSRWEPAECVCVLVIITKELEGGLTGECGRVAVTWGGHVHCRPPAAG
jgi:hypothetical protein